MSSDMSDKLAGAFGVGFVLLMVSLAGYAFYGHFKAITPTHESPYSNGDLASFKIDPNRNAVIESYEWKKSGWKYHCMYMNDIGEVCWAVLDEDNLAFKYDLETPIKLSVSEK
jgi:hypothetical protein